MNGEKLLAVVDWDEPIKPFKPDFFNFHNLKTGKNLRYEEAPDFDMSQFMGFASFEEYMDHVYEYHHFEMNNPELSVREEVVTAMRSLSDRFDFAIVTTRPDRFKAYTLTQMAMVLPGKSVEAYHLEDFHEYGVTKGAFVKNLGAVALIDDRVMNVESAIEVGVHGLLFDDQFNTEYRGPAVRVRNWHEIEDELGRLYESMAG